MMAGGCPELSVRLLGIKRTSRFRRLSRRNKNLRNRPKADIRIDTELIRVWWVLICKNYAAMEAMVHSGVEPLEAQEK